MADKGKPRKGGSNKALEKATAAYEGMKKSASTLRQKAAASKEASLESAASLGGASLGVVGTLGTRKLEKHKTKTRAGIALAGVLGGFVSNVAGYRKIARAAEGVAASLGGALTEQLANEHDAKKKSTEQSAPKQPALPAATKQLPAQAAQQLPKASGAWHQLDAGRTPVDEDGLVEAGAVPRRRPRRGPKPHFSHPHVRARIRAALVRRGVMPDQAEQASQDIATAADFGLEALTDWGDGDPLVQGEPEVAGVIDEVASLMRLLAARNARPATPAGTTSGAEEDQDDEVLAVASGVLMPVRQTNGEVLYADSSGELVTAARAEAALDRVADAAQSGNVFQKATDLWATRKKRRAIRQTARKRKRTAKKTATAQRRNAMVAKSKARYANKGVKEEMEARRHAAEARQYMRQAARNRYAPDESYADEGYADEGYADEGYADEGYADEGYADEGYADEGYYTDGEHETDGEMDTDGEYDTDGEMDTDGEYFTDGEMDTDGEYDTDGEMDTDGEYDTDGDLDTDGEYDTDGDGVMSSW